LIQDPVQELRRGAVQRLIDAAKVKSGDQAGTFTSRHCRPCAMRTRRAFLAGELKKMGVPVDLPKHFGFLMKWHVIGPFDNTERKGFDAVFPPEREIKLDATYDGKEKPVKWQAFESQDEYGKIDLNKPLGMLKEVTGYAVTTFDSPSRTRRGAEAWLQGRVESMGQWRASLRTRRVPSRSADGSVQDESAPEEGANTILVKCCQNEQKEEWTVEWEFQLRVCDAAGTADRQLRRGCEVDRTFPVFPNERPPPILRARLDHERPPFHRSRRRLAAIQGSR
jgi:hypothetical protein